MALQAVQFVNFYATGVYKGYFAPTMDVSFLQWAGTVVAYAPLVNVCSTGEGESIACSGILSYFWFREPGIGGSGEVSVGNQNDTFGLSDSLWVPYNPEQPLMQVTFCLQIFDDSHDHPHGFFRTGASAVPRVEFWD